MANSMIWVFSDLNPHAGRYIPHPAALGSAALFLLGGVEQLLVFFSIPSTHGAVL